jgi:membrane-associated phospholipid phosphatase
MRLFRRSEWVLVVYFIYTAVLAQLLPLRQPVPVLTFTLNLTIIAGYALLAYADSLRRRRFLSIVRDWLPLPLVLMAYREMGWFAPSRHTYELERAWVAWDKFLLSDLGARAAIESLGPVLPSVLEIAYSLVYVIPHFALAMLYVCHCRERADRFLFPFVFAVVVCYALFPYFPSEPPRTAFPGEDFPIWNTVFRRFNWWLLGGYGIHTGVFPSAHVSGAFSAAFAMNYILPERKWVGRVLLVLAVLIATSTVYGRYHYFVDVLAGLGVAVAAFGLMWILGRPRITSPGSGI